MPQLKAAFAGSFLVVCITGPLVACGPILEDGFFDVEAEITTDTCGVVPAALAYSVADGNQWTLRWKITSEDDVYELKNLNGPETYTIVGTVENDEISFTEEVAAGTLSECDINSATAINLKPNGNRFRGNAIAEVKPQCDTLDPCTVEARLDGQRDECVYPCRDGWTMGGRSGRVLLSCRLERRAHAQNRSACHNLDQPIRFGLMLHDRDDRHSRPPHWAG